MAAPVMTKSVVENVLAATSLAASNKTRAYYRDVSNLFEDQVTVSMTTGAAVAGTAGLRVDCFYVYGSTTLNGALTAGATTAVVTSGTGFAKGQKIMIGDEMRTVSAVSGTSLTIDALERNQANGIGVYIMSQMARPSVTLGAAAINTTYSDTFFLGPGTWVVGLTNTDGTNAVTVSVSSGTITGVA
jgi:hypothetical protein